MEPPFRLRASYVHIDVQERQPSGRYDRRYELLVDWTGHVQIRGITQKGGQYLPDALEELSDEIEIIEFHPVGPEDSEPFLTERARRLFAGVITELQHGNGSWHSWDPAAVQVPGP